MKPAAAAPLEERVIACRIDRRGDAMTVIDFLAGRFSYRDRAGWLACIAAGELRLNGGPVAPERRLADGEILSYHPGELSEPPVDENYRIVYRDDRLLVVDKPGNLPVHPAGIFYRHTLWYLLRREFGAIHPVNRLDRETSGLMLVGRDPAAAARLAREGFRKRYLALVFGRFDRVAEAAGMLIPDGRSPVRKKRRWVPADAAVPPEVRAETAVTRLEPVIPGTRRSLVRAIPETGRLHQIRATLFSLGFPLVGDKLYGPDDRIFLKIRNDRIDDADRARLEMPRQALHAAEVEFRHPETGETMYFASPLPGDFLEPA